jgi:hypothetical protein
VIDILVAGKEKLEMRTPWWLNNLNIWLEALTIGFAAGKLFISDDFTSLEHTS